MLRSGEIIFPREDHINWLSNKMVNPENIHKSSIRQAKQVVFTYLGTHRHRHRYTHTQWSYITWNDNSPTPRAIASNTLVFHIENLPFKYWSVGSKDSTNNID